MKTAMQDLREDLLESIVSGTEALQEIESELIKNTCVAMLERVMRNVVKRIDDELLEMEKNQLIDYAQYYLAVKNPKTPSEYFKNK